MSRLLTFVALAGLLVAVQAFTSCTLENRDTCATDDTNGDQRRRLTPAIVQKVSSGTVTDVDLVNALLGDPSLSVSGVTSSCNSDSLGAVDFGATSPFYEGATVTHIGLSTGDLNLAVTDSNIYDGSTGEMGSPGDADLEVILGGGATNDACVLEFDVTSNDGSSKQINFQYYFASEEYNEYVDQFNDAFALWADGVNVALIPGTTTPVTINNVNVNVNSAFYNDNDLDTANPAPFRTAFDGFTTKLTTAPITVPDAGPVHLKIAVADAVDDAFDTATFLVGGSLTVIEPECGRDCELPCWLRNYPLWKWNKKLPKDNFHWCIEEDSSGFAYCVPRLKDATGNRVCKPGAMECQGSGMPQRSGTWPTPCPETSDSPTASPTVSPTTSPTTKPLIPLTTPNPTPKPTKRPTKRPTTLWPTSSPTKNL